MGGDAAPEEIVAGTLLAAQDGIGTLILVGDEMRLRPLLGAGAAGVEIVHAAGQVAMDAPAAQAMRAARGTSLGDAVELVRDGRADMVLPAGNSGDVPGDRARAPAHDPRDRRQTIAAVIPVLAPEPFVLCDAGANVDCRSEWLAQFALMGDAYAKMRARDTPESRVGIVSIGEERSKGNQQTIEAALLLDRTPLNFIGHVEGKDLFEHHADVVVCDGFVGNVILKTSEGAASFFKTMLRDLVDTSPPLAKVGALLLKPSFDKLRQQLSYDTYGGAPLLGVRGACVVAHGRSNRIAIRNAIRNAAALAEKNLDRDPDRL